MLNVDKKALKSGLWYTISNFIIKGMAFITTPIFTRLLTKTEYGSYSNYISALSILTICISLNLDSTFVRAKYDYGKRLNDYIYSVYTLSAVSAVLWLIALNIFNSLATSLIGLDRVYINVLIVSVFASSTISMFQTKERLLFEYRKSVAISLGLAISTSLFGVILVILMKDGYQARVIGQAIPTVLIGLVLSIVLIRDKDTFIFKSWKYALKICLPYIPHLLSMNMLNQMDRLMITKYCGTSDTAIYSVAYSCGAIASILVSSMNNAFSPWLGEKLYNNENEAIRSISKKYIAVFLLLSVGLLLMAPEVLGIMGGLEYADSLFVMAPVAMGVICQFLYTLFVNVEQFNKKTIGMAVASVTAALLNLGLNAYFIPRVGFLAAAYTTLASYIWLLIAHMFLVYKQGYKNVYDYNFIIISLVFMLVIMIGINYLYQLIILRLIILFIYAVIFIILANRHKAIIWSFFK